jgi:hypothetical protein
MVSIRRRINKFSTSCAADTARLSSNSTIKSFLMASIPISDASKMIILQKNVFKKRMEDYRKVD